MALDASDYSALEGGLARMLDRLQAEGTATKDPDVDQFLRDEPNAVLLGLLYDQRVLAETAFAGPYKLRERLGHLDLAAIAEMDRDAFAEVFAAFDTLAFEFVERDGSVVWGGTLPEARRALEVVHRWYQQDLLEMVFL